MTQVVGRAIYKEIAQTTENIFAAGFRQLWQSQSL